MKRFYIAIICLLPLSNLLAEEPTTFNACVKAANGQLYNTNHGQPPLVCNAQDEFISWNQTGPMGPAGPQGAQGSQGAQGLQGEPGTVIGTPIHASDLPLTIDTPGAYYLAEDIRTSGRGILIISSDVSIDLMGQTLSGGSGHAIVAQVGTRNLEVKNGTVSSWTGAGVGLFNATQTSISDIRANHNGSSGIAGGQSSLVLRCTAIGNGGQAGINVGGNSRVINCTSLNNGGSSFWVGLSFTSIFSSVAGGNGEYGFHGAVGSLFENLTAHDNDSAGIFADTGSIIKNCIVFRNGEHGIDVNGLTRVLGNAANNNGGAGIRVRIDGNRVEDNNVSQNDIGIHALSSGNLFLANSARDNGLNYDFGLGNTVGRNWEY